jgi:hypothetical protein
MQCEKTPAKSARQPSFSIGSENGGKPIEALIGQRRAGRTTVADFDAVQLAGLARMHTAAALSGFTGESPKHF